MANNSKINSITCTVIFDGSALNRDEKIGNSILSIKKLTYHGDIRPFISKNAIRHYLFNTLNRYANWGRTPILAQGSGDKQTMQLNLTEADIISFEELAVFGYMFTKSGEGALTRKSPLGITKAMALSNYNQDLAFYANHDFVHRMQEAGKKANPNPINKEEHSGLFKLTFTLDADMIGKDSWIVDNYSFSNNGISIKIAEPQKFIFGNCEIENDEDGIFIGYKINISDKQSAIIKKDGLLVTFPDNKNICSYSKDKKILTLKAELNLENDKGGKKKKFLVEEPIENKEEDETTYSFECTYEPSYNEDKKTLTLELGYEKRIENIVCENEYNIYQKTNTFIFNDEKYNGCRIIAESLDANKPQNGPFKIYFILSEQKKKEIMRQLLFVIKNGLMAQSSNELNSIKPLFILAGDVKIPMPVFHADIDVKKEDGELKVIGVKDAVDNGWLLGNIYLQCNERLSMAPVNDKRITNDWKAFLSAVKIGEDESPAN
jgi:CRISPR-associated protein Cst2